MCGIAGIVQHKKILTQSHLERMLGAIAHRGPDGEGIYATQDLSVMIGHRRLNIIDLSDIAAQPLIREDWQLAVSFNGEIYNFLELREELLKNGYTFRSNSDTEVLLAAYHLWKDEAFHRFNGMWAVAIYDMKAQNLILCRDRFGVKPLYYFQSDNIFAFSSELKAFLEIRPEINLKGDFRALKTALWNPFQLEASHKTLLKHTFNLPAGHILELKQHQVHTRAWWNTADHLVQIPPRANDQVDAFREIFMDACKLRMTSDVDIASSLSGGLDSSSVVSCLHELNRQDLGQRRRRCDHVFVHQFPDTFLDESYFAEQVIRKGDLHAIFVRSEDLTAEIMDQIIFSLESLNMGPTDSIWRIYRAQRRNGFVVSIDGHGSDELLGGYDFSVYERLKDLSLVNPDYWQTLFTIQDMNRQAHFHPQALKNIIKTKLLPSSLLKHIEKSLFKSPFLLEGLLGSDDLYAPSRLDIPFEDHFSRRLYEQFHVDILPKILKNFDAMSMAHGVEVRMPFLDYRLVSFIFSLPVEQKLSGIGSKAILRRSMKSLVPSEILSRKDKIGFNSPIVDWLRGPLRNWTTETLSHVPEVFKTLIDIPQMQTTWHQIQSTPHTVSWLQSAHFWKILHAFRLVRLMGLEDWST